MERQYGGVGHRFHVDSRSGDYVQGHYRLHRSDAFFIDIRRSRVARFYFALKFVD